MKRILTLLFISAIYSSVLGQQYYVPYNLKIDKPEDYRNYEPTIRESIKWYLNSSVGKDADKRSDVSIFFMKWVEGSPDIKVIIDNRIVTFSESSPLLVVPFMMGWVRYSLDNNYINDLYELNKAGIETTLKFYSRNKGFQIADKNIEKLEKLKDRNKLEGFIRKEVRRIEKDREKEKRKELKEKKKKAKFDPSTI